MQAHQSPNKIPHAIATLGLLLAGSIAIAGGSELYRGKAIAPLSVITGAGLIAAGFENDRRNRLQERDYVDGFIYALDLIQSAANFFWQDNKAFVKQVIPVKHLPEKYQSLFEGLIEKMGSEDWVPLFVKRSKLVVGVTRSGKSTWFLYEIPEFYQRYPDGHLTICDLNFGKPDEDGNINTWHDLPRDRFIRVHYEEIFDSIQAEWKELESRRNQAIDNASGAKKQMHFKRRKLLIDEFIAVINEARGRDKLKPSGEPKDLPQLQRWVGDLLYQGLGYQMELTVGLQTLAVGENGLNLAMQEQVNVLLLGASAVNTDNVSRLPTVKESGSLIERLKKVRSMPGCKYAAIAKIGDEISIKVVPLIDPSQFTLKLPEQGQSEDEIWWRSVWTAESQEWLNGLAEKFVSGEIKSPLKSEICPKFGVETRTSDPRYLRVKEAWVNAQQSIKEKV